MKIRNLGLRKETLKRPGGRSRGSWLDAADRMARGYRNEGSAEGRQRREPED